jgi:hypothetical protein
MKQVERASAEEEPESGPELKVVEAPGKAKKEIPPAPLRLPSRFPSRRNRPELAALGWEPRSKRLAR